MVSIVVAFDDNGIIGDKGRLPWNIPEDLRKFKEITLGKVVIMGRKTYESIGKPLPGRVNIVLTKKKNYAPQGVLVCGDFKESIKKAAEYKKEIFVIGGAEIYKQALKVCEKLYVSHIYGEYKGDTYFPELNWDDWVAGSKEKYENWEFVQYIRCRR
jgi:dihydrofolate reductase